MVPALTLEKLSEHVNKKYSGKNAVIGVMFARYDVPQNRDIINESYMYWHEKSGKEFDIYWAGYGKYGGNTTDEIRLDCANAHYDRRAFITFEKIFLEHNIPITDAFQLVLFNVIDGVIIFDSNWVINLEKDLTNSSNELRKQLDRLIVRAQEEKRVENIKTKEFFSSLFTLKNASKAIDLLKFVMEFCEHIHKA